MIKVTILGNNSALPAFDRHPTAQTVEILDQVFLMDCGEGTQKQMHLYGIKPSHINHIFISHLHGDHYFGLVGLLSSMSLWHYTRDIHLYGPPALIDIVNIHFDCVGIKFPYHLIFHPILPGSNELLVNTDRFSVQSFPVEHSIPTHGFIFTEKGGGRKIIPERCHQYEIPKAFYNRLKQGEDYHKKDDSVIKNEWVTAPGNPDRIYAFCADTLHTYSFIDYIKGADLIYHESTFLNDNQEKAKLRFHATAQQAADIAKTAGVKKLLLGHYSSRYQEIAPFELEAKEIFENCEATVEGGNYFVE